MKSIIIKYLAIIVAVFISLALYDLSEKYAIEAGFYYKYNLEQKLNGYEEAIMINNYCDNKANE